MLILFDVIRLRAQLSCRFIHLPCRHVSPCRYDVAFRLAIRHCRAMCFTPRHDTLAIDVLFRYAIFMPLFSLPLTLLRVAADIFSRADTMLLYAFAARDTPTIFSISITLTCRYSRYDDFAMHVFLLYAMLAAAYC